MCLKFFCGLEVKGAENIPREGGFILASNHLSYLDPVAVAVVCPRKLDFMARHDLFSNPLFGCFLSGLGVFPVRRGSADIAALREAMRRIRNNRALVIFPEGRRTVIGETSAAEGGIGLLVKRMKVPVIPAYVKGTDVALPRDAKFIKRARICVYFGKQIFIERRLSRQEIANEILKGIKSLSC